MIFPMICLSEQKKKEAESLQLLSSDVSLISPVHR